MKHRRPAIAARPERVVFLDETAVKTNLTRLRGRAPRGKRLTMDAPFGSWGTQTLIAGLTADALIAPWVIKGAMDGPAFAAYFVGPEHHAVNALGAIPVDFGRLVVPTIAISIARISAQIARR